MRGRNGKFCISEKNRSRYWKDYMGSLMNCEDDWDHNVEGDTIDGLVDGVKVEVVVQAFKEMETGKACAPSNGSLELIAADGEVRSERWLSYVIEI